MPQLDFNNGAAAFTDNDIHAQIVSWPKKKTRADWGGGFVEKGWTGKDIQHFGGGGGISMTYDVYGNHCNWDKWKMETVIYNDNVS